MHCPVSLEPAALQLAARTARSPMIFSLPPEAGRAVLSQAQASPVFMYPARLCRLNADTSGFGRIPVYIVAAEDIPLRPLAKSAAKNNSAAEPASAAQNLILYIHGGGWVFGGFDTHEALIRELAARTRSVVVFPEYSRSPEARYPVALEQCYSLLCQLPAIAEALGISLCSETVTIAGDSAGGNLAAALALLAKQRGGPFIHKQLLYYPVTDACFDTSSYRDFACGYYLYREGMRWFWEQYLPSEAQRFRITASPLKASLSELARLPQAMIVNGEADVLRDEGLAFGRRLRRAGVPVAPLLIPGALHDFVMLHALRQTEGCRCAMDSCVAWINRKNDEALAFRQP